MVKNATIRVKLTLALFVAALLAFAAAIAAFALFERFTLERRAQRVMEPYVQLVSVGAEAAVAFTDAERAREILTTLRANSQITGAEIILEDGRLLARYARSGVSLSPGPLKADGVHLYHNTAELIQGLPDGAHVRLVINLDELNRQTLDVVLMFGAGMVVLLTAVTLGLRTALQRTIVHPISFLAETIEQVRARADYRQRVPAAGDDEVARLGRNFNDMMEAIQKGDGDLRRFAQFQKTLLDSAAYGIISTTPEGMITSFNPAVERMLGLRADEVIGKCTPVRWHDPEELALRARQLSEELKETVTPGFDVFAARPRRNLPEEHEWTFIRKDGTRIPVLVSVSALRGEGGEITGFVGLAYDLTERRRAEEERRESEARYRRIVDTANEGICSLGPDALISFVNARMAEMLGCSGAEMIGRPLTDFMFDEDAPDHLRKIESRRRGLSEYYERRFRRTNGETVWTLVSAAPIFDDRRRFQGSFAMFADITERKLAEEELQRLKNALEQRVRERTAELEVKNKELEKINKLFVGRELRMAELKERIKELKRQGT